MSRYSPDDARDDRTAPASVRAPDGGPGREPEDKHYREPDVEEETRLGSGSSATDFLDRHLDLDRVEWRDRDEEYDRTADHGGLDRADLETLATIGAFRVVATEDLKGSSEDRHGDLRRLSDQGLVTRETLTDRSGSRHTVSLTSSGKALVEAHRHPDGRDRRQAFHAGAVKPRELAHDVEVYRVFKAERSNIEADGGRIVRVVLDYELKREYQRFLNRDDKPEDATLASDRQAFAEAYGLRVIDRHLELPDLRIEYEDAHGRVEYRDVEVVTEHYSRGQISGKTQAGFACYRASGGTRGGTPFDPRHLSRLP